MEFPDEQISTESPAAPGKKSRRKVLVTIVVLLAVIGIAGWRWSARRSRPAETPQQPKVESLLHLESFLVNLADKDDRVYLRIGIDLGLAEAPKKSESGADPTPAVRDTVLGILGTRTADDLLSPEGKTKLKQDLVQSLNTRLPQLRVREVYLTDFLVQH